MKKFIIIKTKEQGYFITDNVDNAHYFNSNISKLRFDEQLLEKSFKEHWYKIKDIPKIVERIEPDKYINRRYELKDKYPVTEMTPKIILEMDDDSDIIKLYDYKYDIITNEWQSIDFEYDLIDTESLYENTPKYPYSNFIMDQLMYPSIMLPNKPCGIKGSELYTIIREYIKLHIDNKYARVTSDYDFCFTVKKVIKLYEPVSYTRDMGTKKRPKLTTIYNYDKQVVVFETAPKEYQKYPVQHGLIANSYAELELKIDNYLKELIEHINKPIIECVSCKGTGIVLDMSDKVL